MAVMGRRRVMFNYRVLAVIKRELREKLFSKAFIFMTLLVPGFMILILGIQAILYTSETKNLKIDIISETSGMTNAFQNEMSSTDLVRKGNYVFSYLTMSRDEVKNYLDEKKQMLLDENIGGIVYIPASAMKDKKVEYYSKSSKNITLFRELSGPINNTLINFYFNNKSLSKEELDFARTNVDFTGFKVSKEEGYKEEGYGNLVLAYLFTF